MFGYLEVAEVKKKTKVASKNKKVKSITFLMILVFVSHLLEEESNGRWIK